MELSLTSDRLTGVPLSVIVNLIGAWVAVEAAHVEVEVPRVAALVSADLVAWSVDW